MTDYKYKCPQCGSGSNDTKDMFIMFFCSKCYGGK